MDLLAELAQTREWSMGLDAVTRYTCRVGEVPYLDLAELAEQAIGPEAKEVVVTTAERLMLEGERRVLLRQLRKRFVTVPKDVEKRIEQASESELETWSDRVIDAATIDEVFAEGE